MEARLFLHRLMGEWTCCHSCLSNSKMPFPHLSVYYCNLACCMFYWNVNILLNLTFSWDIIFITLFVLLCYFRIWDCLQHVGGVGVRTRPVILCTRTGTNLQCALNVAANWPRKHPKDQRWKLRSSLLFSRQNSVEVISSCISHPLTLHKTNPGSLHSLFREVLNLS